MLYIIRQGAVSGIVGKVGIYMVVRGFACG